MKKTVCMILLGLGMNSFPVFLQETPDSAGADEEYYAITLSGTRLFEDMENLGSVLVIIPKGEKVRIFEEYGDYYLAEYDGMSGYLRIDQTKFTEETEKKLEEIWAEEHPETYTEERVQEENRTEAMIARYGEEMGPKIAQKAIWKGLSREVVYDSWGKPRDIKRYNEQGMVVEVWTYANKVVLYFRDDLLDSWNTPR